MYYTGLDPRTMEPVYVPTDPHEKEMQRALIQYRDPKNYALIHEALVKAGRTDLIGYGPKCLIRAAARQKKAPHPAQKQPAQKRPAQKRRGPQKRNLRQSRARRSPPQRSRAERSAGEAFGKPTAAQLRQAERYLKTRKKKSLLSKTNQAKSFRGKKRVKGNRQGVLSRLIASRGGTFDKQKGRNRYETFQL